MAIDDFFSDILPDSNTDFFSFGNVITGALPLITQALTRFAIGGNAQRSRNQAAAFEQIAGTFFGRGISGSLPPVRLPAATPPFVPGDDRQGRYFGTSQGQSMAQIAAAIVRASQRYL